MLSSSRSCTSCGRSLWDARDAAGPALRLAAAVDGPALPVILADALVAPPLAVGAAPPTVVRVGEAAAAPGTSAPPAGRRRAWPLSLLLLAASIAIAIEALLARPRGLDLGLRAVAIAALALGATRGLRAPPRRIAFVLDVSDSVDGAAARASLAARTAALAGGDRASLTIVAGGARDVVPLGPPSRVAAWLRAAPLDRAEPRRSAFLAEARSEIAVHRGRPPT